MAHTGPGQGPRQPFGAVYHGCFAHSISSTLTMHMRCSRSLFVREQATTHLVEFLTREKLVPLGIFNPHHCDSKIETPSLMEICGENATRANVHAAILTVISDARKVLFLCK